MTRASLSETRLPEVAVGSKRTNFSFCALASAAIGVGFTASVPAGSVHAPGRIERTAGAGTRSVARTLPAYIGRFTSNAPSFTDASVQSAA